MNKERTTERQKEKQRQKEMKEERKVKFMSLGPYQFVTN